MAIDQRGFNIAEFRSLVNRKGIARNNQYKVLMTPPPDLRATFPDITGPRSVEDIFLYAESITLPGLQLATLQARNNTIGPVEYKPYVPVFGETLPITFYVDTYSIWFDFFHTWMRTAVNYTTEGRGYYSTEFNGAAPFEVSYPQSYKCDLDILVLDPDLGGKIITSYKVLKAFPVSIPDHTMSYGQTDNLMTITVNFSYFEWFTSNLATGASVPGVDMTPLVPRTPTPTQEPLTNTDALGNPLPL